VFPAATKVPREDKFHTLSISGESRRRSCRVSTALDHKDLAMPNILGIGTDIVECLRITRLVQRHGEQFVQRVYTTDEVSYCQSRKQSMQHYAGRWAAKEAILKALGTGWVRGIGWRDVEVINDGSGRPVVELHGRARELSEEAGIDEIIVSISHCRSHAVAYALALGD